MVNLQFTKVTLSLPSFLHIERRSFTQYEGRKKSRKEGRKEERKEGRRKEGIPWSTYSLLKSPFRFLPSFLPSFFPTFLPSFILSEGPSLNMKEGKKEGRNTLVNLQFTKVILSLPSFLHIERGSFTKYERK